MSLRWLVMGVALGATVGCYGVFNFGDNGSNHHNNNNNTQQTPSGSGPTDVPCDVANALASCLGCHGSTLSGGAPMSLASAADLMADSPTYPGQSEAQRAVARMQGNPSIMPPAPASPSPQADIDAINAWITAGYPTGTCNTTVCTSGVTSTSYEGTSEMLPGEACINCHAQGGEGPKYQFMGTIYPTLHEPNDCVGASGQSYAGVQVTAQDANGHSITMAPNSAGNFCSGSHCSVVTSNGTVSGPYTVKVTYQGKEIDMTTPQTSGDCNACHTEAGTNAAPGRVHLP